LLEEFEYFLDSLGVKLVADLVKILTLVLPEVNLDKWIGMVAILEGTLWILLEYVLDLSGPVNDGKLKKLSLVLTRCLLA